MLTACVTQYYEMYLHGIVNTKKGEQSCTASYCPQFIAGQKTLYEF